MKDTPGQQMEETSIVFSIMMITYNHEHFIEKALESILSQEFPFKKEIVIGIDKCSDRTAEICHAYQQAHPDELIVLLNRQQNIGMYGNFCETLKQCQGKYIAILEGDDFWTDTKKLIKQFQYFEHHPHCILSGSYAQIVNEQSKLTRKPSINKLATGKKYFKDDLILANRFPTLTVAFRRDRLCWDRIGALNQSPHLDWPFYLSLEFNRNDYAFKFNEYFGAYRQHSGGVYSMLSEKKKLANTAKTVLSIHKIMQHNDHKWYLKSLYNNLLKEEAAVLIPEPNELNDQGFIIYEEKRIKRSYLKDVTSSARQYLLKGNGFLFTFQSKVELIRQTKYSKRNYFQLMGSPLIALGLLKMYFKR